MSLFSKISFRPKRGQIMKEKPNAMTAAEQTIAQKSLPEQANSLSLLPMPKESSQASVRTLGSIWLHDETLLKVSSSSSITQLNYNGNSAASLTKGLSAAGNENPASHQLTFLHIVKDTKLSEWSVRALSTPPDVGFDDVLIVEGMTSRHLPTAEEYATWIWCTLYWYFQLSKPAVPPGIKAGAPQREWQVNIQGGSAEGYRSLLYAVERMGLLFSSSTSAAQDEKETFSIYRKTFWQIPADIFYKSPNGLSGIYAATPHPLYFTLPINNSRHPARPKPPPPGTTFYRRYIPSLNSFLSFRTANLKTDVQLLYQWMNNPRVNAFWGECGSEEHQREFLRKGLCDGHCFPVIGSWTDLSATDTANGNEGQDNSGVAGEVTREVQEVPFGYFEIYWVKEDRLAGYTQTEEWDRGVHVLVGEERFRGYHRVEVWLSSLVHFMFLSDPRTMTLMLEPRVDNEKFINYLIRAGFYKEKEFAFPHKQAAVMKLKREAWNGPAC